MIAAFVLAAVTSAPQQFTTLPLSAALERAVAVSPDVLQARERVHEQTALLAAARSSASPAITANYAQSPQAGNADNTVTQRLVTLGGQITLGDYLAYSPVIRQARANLEAAQFDLIAAQRAERTKVVGLYFTALKAVATLQLRNEQVSAAQSDLNAAGLRFRAGDAPRLDVVRAQVSLARAQADRNFAATDLANARSALSVELDQPVTLAFSNATQPAIASSNPQSFVDQALARRSDLASAQQIVDAEAAAVSVSERGVLPAVIVNAGYTAGTDTGIFVHGPSANILLTFPVSHGAADRAEAERARLAQAQAKVTSLRKQISVEVAAAARTYAESVIATQIATRARIAAQQELAATEIGYRSGASSSLDVADARRTYTQAAMDELTAIYAQEQALAELQEESGP